jgi:hypothetical protein
LAVSFPAILSITGLGITKKPPWRRHHDPLDGFRVEGKEYLDETDERAWDNENPMIAAAWMPRHQMKGKTLHLALLAALFAAEKNDSSADGPNFNEVIGSGNPVLSSEEVRALARSSFGESG